MSWDIILGYFTGVRLFAPRIDPDSLLRTLLVIHTLDCLMCRLICHNNGYRKNLWTLLGFIFGIWALAVLIVLPRRRDVGVRAGDPEVGNGR